MAFAWPDLLVLARTLTDGDEAAGRTAVSRACYAAFDIAKEWAESHGFAGPAGGAASHWQVWTYFRHRPEPSLRRAAALGQPLRRRSTQADHDGTATPAPADGEGSILKAERILTALSVG